jgi:hypothetical protein
MRILDPLCTRKECRWKVLQIGVFVFFVILFFIEVRVLVRKLPLESVAIKEEPFPSVDCDLIGKGVLSLSYRIQFPEMVPLVQDLIVIGKNTRPDKSAFNAICLGLKTSGQKEDLFCGQRVFISCDNGVFRFSEAKTGCFVTPIDTQGVGVGVEIIMDGKKEVVTFSVSNFSQKSIDDEKYIETLQGGIFWGPDLFLQQYGGEEYRPLYTKCKIEIGGNIYFLSIGDTLWWDGQYWKAGSSSFAPILKIISSNTFGVKAQVWNVNGYVSRVFQFPLQQVTKELRVKKEDFITSVRVRSPSEITCQLGKSRVTIREGDWWVCHEGRWIRLKNNDELELFLHHEISGDLVIFEKFENENERIILKGVCFDKMRTKEEVLCLVFPVVARCVDRTKKMDGESGGGILVKRRSLDHNRRRSLRSRGN